MRRSWTENKEGWTISTKDFHMTNEIYHKGPVVYCYYHRGSTEPYVWSNIEPNNYLFDLDCAYVWLEGKFECPFWQDSSFVFNSYLNPIKDLDIQDNITHQDLIKRMGRLYDVCEAVANETFPDVDNGENNPVLMGQLRTLREDLLHLIEPYMYRLCVKHTDYENDTDCFSGDKYQKVLDVAYYEETLKAQEKQIADLKKQMERMQNELKEKEKELNVHKEL